MERIAVFPGSFDPITRGHESIVRRALPLFTRVIIAIGENSGKNSYFSLEQRIAWIQRVFSDLPQVSVASYAGLTIDFCKLQGAAYILRGLRSSADFEFERSIGQMNHIMHPGIETVFLLSLPEFAPVSSSIVREIIRHHGDATPFLPDGVNPETLKKRS